jgi:hypothetical protein
LLTGTRRAGFGVISRTTFPSGPTTARAIVGWNSRPPLTSAEYARPSCSGLTVTSPCPIALSAASPIRNRQPSEQFSRASAVRNARRAGSATSG